MSGEEPFPELSGLEAATKIGYEGLRLTLGPEIEADPLLEELMERCFSSEPEKRPSFSEIARMFGK